jgi:uncharacterized protein YbjT (DUF2867 family)
LVGPYPIFLRTGHGSGKHDYRKTCYVPSASDLARHVVELVEWSACASLIGLPTTTWAVRELLALEAAFTAFLGALPIGQERRCFIDAGAVVCAHPYWPPAVFEDELARPSIAAWRDALAAQEAQYQRERKTVLALARQAAGHFEGAWSLDLARTRDGRWVAIDMAPAEVSYHWPGCPADRWGADSN